MLFRISNVIFELVEVVRLSVLCHAVSQLLKIWPAQPKGICLVKIKLEQTYGLIGGEPSLDAAINYSNIGCLEISIPDEALVA